MARAFLAGLAAAAAVVAALAAGARAGEPPASPGPLGPVFGDNSYRGAIRDDGAVDVDDFVGPLAVGETLSVSVAAEGEGGLRPGLVLLGPDGVERAPALRVSGGGARVDLRRFPADRTGRWVVRVVGLEETEGAYRVRFRVGRARAGGVRRVRLGGDGPRVAVATFEALRGSALSLRLGPVAGGGAPLLFDVLDPAGGRVPSPGALLERRGRSLVLPPLPLDGPEGTWRVLVGLDGGAGPAALSLRVRPPLRPRGSAVLDPSEPFLEVPEAPVEGVAGGILRLRGRNLSPDPRPAVLLGGIPAEVGGVGDSGEYLDLILPATASDGPRDVVVVNPDGQAFAAPALVRVLGREPAWSLGLAPRDAVVLPGGRLRVELRLGAPAPPEGAEVALACEGAEASAPASVRLDPFALGTAFDLVAGPVPGSGRLTAAWRGTAALDFRVVPPPAPKEIDLSGWRLVQTDSARSLTLPAGTRLVPGGSLVVARKSPLTAFQSFWNVSLGTKVVFVDSGDAFPSLNGSETISIRDADGVLVDGPSVALTAGNVYRRRPGEPSGSASSWDVDVAVPGMADPGGASPPAAAGLFLRQIADPGASGAWVHEFVEVRWDPE